MLQPLPQANMRIMRPMFDDVSGISGQRRQGGEGDGNGEYLERQTS